MGDMVDMVVDISESVPLMPSQRLRLMLSMVLMDMVDMLVLDTVPTPMDWVLLAMVVLDILATPPLAIAVDMVDMVVDISESVPLMPSQRLMLMLSMVLMDMVDMVDMVALDTVHTPMDLVLLDILASPPLAIAVDMVDMVVDILESVPLMPSQRLRLMLSMVLMDMVDTLVLDTVPTPMD